ncbi:hypothetical protein GQ44DRAFT_755752 [Phaeosphaeriaceae sp. PMI808]|nr:hypothetical protein GQ44DRAFT_755752 [Phaeosphaeriaceae sp. PMI808]
MAMHDNHAELALDTKDHSAYDVAHDLRGRKHVERDNNADGVYWMACNTHSVHTVFPMPGKISANSFRHFLQGHLQSNLITDEYGNITPIEKITDDHLPALQAQLWRGLDNDIRSHRISSEFLVQANDQLVESQINSLTSDARKALESRDIFHLGDHIAIIAELLQLDHIFIVCKKTQSTCAIPDCRTLSGQRPLSSSIVVIEPLIHWGTVTPAVDIVLGHGRVQAFRRSGEKRHDPLWTEAIMRLSPPNPLAYCFGCLDMLMMWRMEALGKMGAQKVASFTAVNARPKDIHFAGQPFEKKDKDSFVIRPVIGASKINSEDGQQAPKAKLSDQTPIASFNLDGSCGFLPPAKHSKLQLEHNKHGLKRSNSYDRDTSEPFEDTDDSEGAFASECLNDSLFRHDSFTYLSPTTFEQQYYSDPARFSPRKPLNSNTLPFCMQNVSKSHGNNSKSFEVYEYNPISSFKCVNPPEEREQGFERENSANEDVDPIKGASVNLRLSLKMAEKDNNATRPTRLESLNHISDSSSHIPVTQVRNRSEKPKRISKPYTKPKPPHTPAYADQSPVDPLDVPNIIDLETYLDYKNCAPSPKQIICSCRKPARTREVRIAQCRGRECRIGWYHHACLDKRTKINVFWHKFKCESCKDDEFYQYLRETNGWTAEEQMKQAARLPFNGQDIVNAMPGLGGQIASANPYGLGLVQVRDTPEPERPQGTLGSLAFMGYAESRPFLVNEAYTNPRSTIDMLDTEADEEDYEYGEEYDYYDGDEWGYDDEEGGYGEDAEMAT